ncbi:MAG: hypothetical protein RQ966_05140 [Acetobacteraceae bacterium]|nr:hypothetical protein [Acetobacteraceae bacterium]
MSTFTWNTNSGAFDSGGNWTPAGPPTAADTALFSAGSGTISGFGTVATLQMNPSGPWVWTGTITAKNFNINDTTTLSSGAAWTLAGSPSSSNYLVVGSGSGGTGTLAVTGGASIVSTQPASTSAYAVYVGSGTFANANGTMLVTGAGSTVNTGPNGAAVGETGTGTLTVQSGATATFASSNSSLIAALAVGRNGAGTVNVSGAGTSVTANGFVYVGRGGAGTLNIANTATLTAGSAASGSTSSYGINIGDSTGASATTVAFGGSGTAHITTGGVLHSLGNINLGFDGTAGTLTVDGTGSQAKADGTVNVGGGIMRAGGSGTLTIQNGGVVQAGTPATGTAAISIGGGMTGDTGTVLVSGTGSLLDAHGFRISIGTASNNATDKTGGSGTLNISGGAHVLAGSNYSDTEAALALAGYAGGTATLGITGAGSQLIVDGTAVIGGTIINGAAVTGGTATVTVTSGALLQTGAEIVQSGSKLTVDAASTLKTPTLTINGGAADLATLNSATAIGFGTGGKLTLHAISGTNAISNFGAGDTIDFAGNTATVSGNTVTVGGGTITLGGTAPNGGYQVVSDGQGGTQIAIPASGVFRFFEQTNGTHFYTSSESEARNLVDPNSSSYRADLTPETNEFGAYAPSANDPNVAQVFRFFDQAHGTEFLTASKTEATGLMTQGSSTYRSDLTFEAGSSFYEHTTQQSGDVAVYRFFDKIFGTHFYTGSRDEYQSLTTLGGAGYRADLVSEGIGFYAPSGSYTPGGSSMPTSGLRMV